MMVPPRSPFVWQYPSVTNLEMIAGVRLEQLQSHPDSRGTFTEIFRRSWPTGVNPVQWNVVRSAPGVMRGVHVHPVHDDYLALVAGRATVGLCDLRPGASTSGLTLEMDGLAPTALTIPHGVAHGFLFHEQSMHVYATSEYFGAADELGCRWDDPQLGIPWPVSKVMLSPRDEGLPALAELRRQLPW